MKLDELGMLAVVPANDSSAIAYMNVFERGDIWLRIKGCEDCPHESRNKCCGPCPMLSEKGCFLHLDDNQNKPLRCVIHPVPRINLTWCSIQYECIQGSMLGQIRKISEPLNAELHKAINSTLP